MFFNAVHRFYFLKGKYHISCLADESYDSYELSEIIITPYLFTLPLGAIFPPCNVSKLGDQLPYSWGCARPFTLELLLKDFRVQGSTNHTKNVESTNHTKQ
jgi:hypothetical protein